MSSPPLVPPLITKQISTDYPLIKKISSFWFVSQGSVAEGKWRSILPPLPGANRQALEFQPPLLRPARRGCCERHPGPPVPEREYLHLGIMAIVARCLVDDSDESGSGAGTPYVGRRPSSSRGVADTSPTPASFTAQASGTAFRASDTMADIPTVQLSPLVKTRLSLWHQ